MKAKFLVFFIPVFIFSQTEKIKQKKQPFSEFRKEFRDACTKPAFNTEEYYQMGVKMLSIAKNDSERAKSYGQMGDGMRKKMRYSEAVVLLQKAGYYSERSNYTSERFMINFLLSGTFRSMGLNVQSNNSWEIAFQMAKKLKDSTKLYSLNQLRAANLEMDKKYTAAIPYEINVCKYNEKFFNRTFSDKDRIELGISYLLLSFDYIKCNNILEAKKYIKEFEKIFAPSDIYYNYCIERYYMIKGILYSKENQDSLAGLWFDKAIRTASSNGNNEMLKSILEERLISNCENYHVEDEKKLIKRYINLNDLRNKETAEVSKEIFENQQNNFNTQKIKINIFYFIFLILIFVIIIILCIYFQQKKKATIHFNNIIKSIEGQQRLDQNNLNSKEAYKTRVLVSVNNKNDDIKNAAVDEKIQKIISGDKEKELLEKLTLFESGKEFTSKHFTISNLASILQTNIKYIGYIIKTHRGKKNFNEYINGLRIKFITEQLYQKPEYLTYKINYLSEISGFSSHSRFTYVFKKELEISPSDFINHLRKYNKG